jgi:tetratricopeptide (TPR) repeat protein
MQSSLLLAVLILIPPPARPAPPQEPEDLYRRGVSLMEVSRPLEAEAVFRSVLRRDPRDNSARILLGRLLVNRGAPRDAEKEFRLVLRAEPRNASARMGLGDALELLGDVTGAAREFEALLDDPIQGTAARSRWIRALFLGGRDEIALQEASKAVEELPGAEAYQRLYGFLLQTMGRKRDALAAFERAAALEPDVPETQAALISLYLDTGQPRQALEWCDRALRADRGNPLLHADRARALEQLGRTAEAGQSRAAGDRIIAAERLYLEVVRARRDGDRSAEEAALRRVLKGNPTSARALSDLGELLQASGRLSEARRAFQEAVAADARDGRACAGLASVLENEGNAAEAIDVLRRALAAGIAGPDVRVGLAVALSKAGRDREAAVEMEAAIRSFPVEASFVAYLADLRRGMGASAAAQEGFNAALRLDPRSPAAWEGKVRTLLESRDSAGAETACRQCLQADIANAYCREALASTLLNAGRYREAAENYRLLMKDLSPSKSALEGLAYALVRTSARKEAIALYQSSLGRFGEDASVRSALGYLYRMEGDLPAASLNYSKAHALSPADADVAHDFGMVLYLSRDFRGAAGRIESALRLRPDWGMAHFNVSMAYWHLGRPALALAHARRAESLGVGEARWVVRTLTAELSLGVPRTIRSAQRPE